MKSDLPRLDQSHSVTRLIQQLGQDDRNAATEIWQLYFQRLLPVARAKILKVSDPAFDEEDILVSVFDRFFTAASNGRFANLNDRDDLWQILLVLTERSAIDHHRQSTAEKRGRDRIVSQSALAKTDIGQLREMADRGPSPEYITSFNEQLAGSLYQLQNTNTREVAILKLEGYSNQEISQTLQISISTVERKLNVIRQLWQERFEQQ